MKPVPPEGFLRSPLVPGDPGAASVNQMSRRAIENFTGNEFRSPRSRPAPSPHPAQLNIHNIQIYTYFSFLCILVVCVAFTMEPENLIFPDVTRLGPLSAHTAPQSLLRTPHSAHWSLVTDVWGQCGYTGTNFCPFLNANYLINKWSPCRHLANTDSVHSEKLSETRM